MKNHDALTALIKVRVGEHVEQESRRALKVEAPAAVQVELPTTPAVPAPIGRKRLLGSDAIGGTAMAL